MALIQFGWGINLAPDIHRKLRALIDKSAGEHIQTLRMQRAAEMLKEGVGTIAEIAFRVGFGDPSYFSKCFRKHFGVSPSEYPPA